MPENWYRSLWLANLLQWTWEITVAAKCVGGIRQETLGKREEDDMQHKQTVDIAVNVYGPFTLFLRNPCVFCWFLFSI